MYPRLGSRACGVLRRGIGAPCDREIAEFARKGTAPITSVWAPFEAVDGILSYPGITLDDDYEAWRTETPRPGFVRLVSISNGRASFSLVAYESTGSA